MRERGFGNKLDAFEPSGRFLGDLPRCLLARQKLAALSGNQFMIVNVRARAEPSDDLPVGVAQRNGAAQMPAILSVRRAPEAVLDLVILARFDRPGPASHAALRVFRVQDRLPAPAKGLL